MLFGLLDSICYTLYTLGFDEFDMVMFSALLKLFTTSEIMRWQHLCTTYETKLREETSCTPMFIPNTTLGDGRWTDLKHRVVEHVRMIEMPVSVRSLIPKPSHHLRLAPPVEPWNKANLICSHL